MLRSGSSMCGGQLVMGRAQIAWEIPVLRSGSSMCGGQLAWIEHR